MPSKLPYKNPDTGETEYYEIDLFDLFPPQEGSMNQYYGRIGEGKTYAATADAIADLNSGHVVYTSWPIKWDGYDERESRLARLLYRVGVKRYFNVYPAENWHFFDMNADDALDVLATLTDCIIYLDEGHLLLDSYVGTKMRVQDRAAILHTRHYDRTINVISQRPTAIHVTVRANVNRFFKLEKTTDFKIPFTKIRLVRFSKTEFQDTGADDKPDETKLIDEDGNEGEYKYAIATDMYWSRAAIRDAYESKYLRRGMGHSQPQNAMRVLLDGSPYPLTDAEVAVLKKSPILEQ